MRTLELVQFFHEACGKPSPHRPTIDPDDAKLRVSLIQEELNELEDAASNFDLVGVLDALVDLQYVLDGAFIAFGMGEIKDVAFDEVHRSNMTKFDGIDEPILREDGKLMKGPNYEAPQLEQFLEDA